MYYFMITILDTNSLVSALGNDAPQSVQEEEYYEAPMPVHKRKNKVPPPTPPRREL